MNVNIRGCRKNAGEGDRVPGLRYGAGAGPQRPGDESAVGRVEMNDHSISLTAGRRPIALGACALAITWALAAGGAAAAQEVAPSDDADRTIVVTAQKREQALNDVPLSVTAFGAEQLASRGIDSTVDLANSVPGFTYTESRIGTPIYTLRGVGFNDIALGGRPTVSVYQDEAPIPFTVETRGGFLDLERVEVLAGPQGTLFGQNATGGAINLIAAKPTDVFKGSLTAGYGRFNEVTLGGFVSGPISDTLKFRLAVKSEQADGWQYSTTTGDTNGKKNLISGRFLLEWTPAEALRVNLNLNGFLDRSDNQSPQYLLARPSDPTAAANIPGLATLVVPPRNNRATDFNPGDYARDNDFLQANLRIDYDLNDQLTLTSLSSYSKYNQNQLQDLDGTPLIGLTQRTMGDIESFAQELRIAGDLTDQLYVVIGANYADDKTRERVSGDLSESTQAYAFVGLGLPPFYSFGLRHDQDITTYALFGNAEFKLTDALTLQAGVRYTNSNNRFVGCTRDIDGVTNQVFSGFHDFVRTVVLGLPALAPIPAGGCITADALQVPQLVTSRLKEDNVSWRFGADYEIADDVKVYANVSRGYKAGGYPSLAATSTAQYDPTLQESLTAYEAGLKAAFSRDFQLNAAIYHYDYRDKQLLGIVADPSFGRLLRLLNVPKSRINGAELQLAWSPVRGLDITGNASYVDSKITAPFVAEDPNGVTADFNGQAFPNSPKWQLSGDVNYEVPVSDRLNAIFGASASYRSTTNSELGRLPELVVEDYALVNLRVGFADSDKKWRLMAWMNNVGDKYYYTSATRSIDVFNRMTGAPRTFGLTFTYNFQP
jgi:outer membrane receptor protein involved in Fe transport